MGGKQIFAAALGALLLGATQVDDAPLNQGAWAVMLAERMKLSEDLPQGAPADEAIGLLGTRGLTILRDAKAAQLAIADGPQRSWRYDITIPKTATWLITVRNTSPAFVSVDKGASKLAPSAGVDGSSDVTAVPLRAGPHSVTISMNNVPTAPDIGLVAGCNPVIPAGGWQGAQSLTFGGLGRTLVQSLRQNGRLPAAEALAIVPVKTARTAITAPSEGTYTLLVSGRAFDRATYRIDGCTETTPTPNAADGWREGATVLLTAGEHVLSLEGFDATKNDGRVRLVRRSSADDEYLAVLQSMGVKLPHLGGKDGKSASLESGDGRVRLVRRANGDAQAGLAALANRKVTKAEAEAILEQPVIAKLLAGGFPPRPRATPRAGEDPFPDVAPIDEPVTGILQPAEEADPR